MSRQLFCEECLKKIEKNERPDPKCPDCGINTLPDHRVGYDCYEKMMKQDYPPPTN